MSYVVFQASHFLRPGLFKCAMKAADLAVRRPPRPPRPRFILALFRTIFTLAALAICQSTSPSSLSPSQTRTNACCLFTPHQRLRLPRPLPQRNSPRGYSVIIPVNRPTFDRHVPDASPALPDDFGSRYLHTPERTRALPRIRNA